MRKPEVKRRKTWQGSDKITRAKHIAEVKALVASIKAIPCMDCGQRFPEVCMDFDHREPQTKKKAVANLVSQAFSLVTVLAEIEKCDIVCSNCHRIRHHG